MSSLLTKTRHTSRKSWSNKKGDVCLITPPPPELQVLNNENTLELVKNEKHCRILGLNIKQNLTWSSHLEDGEKPLLPSLRKCLGALKHASKLIPCSSRNTLARGLILSKLSYLICIWGGATPNLLRKAQTLQNMAARWVTRSSRRTKISTLLELTGWFSIRELTSLSSATITWKIINMRTPRKLHDTLSWDPITLKFDTKETRLDFTKANFTYRACKEWNNIPDHIRTIGNISKFKKHMKSWIKEKRPRMPD